MSLRLIDALTTMDPVSATNLEDPGWLRFERDGVRLALRDFGGEGPPALLLHGLAGDVGEWEGTAAWLRRDRRVFALDLRGHGRSERAGVGGGAGARRAVREFLGELGRGDGGR